MRPRAGCHWQLACQCPFRAGTGKQVAGGTGPRGGYTLIEMLCTVAALVIVLGLMVSLARHVRERSKQSVTEGLLLKLDRLMEQYAARNHNRLPVVTPLIPVLGTTLTAAPVGATQLQLSPAAATEVVRQIGHSGTFCVTDPPTRDGPLATHSLVFSAVDAASGLVTVLPLQFPVAEGSPVQPEGARVDENLLQACALQNNRDFVRILRSQEDLAAKVFADLPMTIYDEVTLRDAWGRVIVFMPAYHPQVGTAFGNRFFFFSAGPDGRYLTRDDNLYSYERPGGGTSGTSSDGPNGP